MSPRVCLLSGGVGGSKLAWGLYQVMPRADLTIIANTGDDIDMFGLRVCPDLDILLYTLTGQVDQEKGWGIRGETFRALERVRALGGTGWFNLGDVDIGLHLARRERLAAGEPLSRIMAAVAAADGLACRLLPMSDEPVTTRVRTPMGELHLQEYLIRERAEPRVQGLRFAGSQAAAPAPGVLDALTQADLIILAPSNPLISIGPILAVPGVREAIAGSGALRIGVCPLVGGASLKGPTDRMLADLGHEVSPAGVARLYAGLLDEYVVDTRDAAAQPAVEALGMRCHAWPTVMHDDAGKLALARAVLARAPGAAA